MLLVFVNNYLNLAKFNSLDVKKSLVNYWFGQMVSAVFILTF